MNVKEMDTVTAHFDKYFEQDDCIVLHPTADMNPHIDLMCCLILYGARCAVYSELRVMNEAEKRHDL